MTVRSLDNGPAGDTEPVSAELAALAELAGMAEQMSRQLPGPVSRLTLRRGEDLIEVEWASASAAPPAVLLADQPTSAAVADRAPEPSPAVTPVTELRSVGHHELAAPLVGTFYRCPEPGAAPFVSPGDVVQPGQQVAIIEAMKMLVSVNADEAATVVEVLVKDGRPVEYGQPLMLLSPLADTAADR